MGAKTTIEGNLGGNPELKFIDVKNGAGATESRAVCEFSVFQSHEKRNKETDEWEDAGGFWVEVSVWGHRAENLAKVLKKGYAVAVPGNLYIHNWTDNDNVNRVTFKLEARDVTMQLYNVETINLRPKNTAQAPANS